MWNGEGMWPVMFRVTVWVLFLTTCRKEAKTIFPLQLTRAVRLEGATLANRLAASRNYKHSCVAAPLSGTQLIQLWSSNSQRRCWRREVLRTSRSKCHASIRNCALRQSTAYTLSSLKPWHRSVMHQRFVIAHSGDSLCTKASRQPMRLGTLVAGLWSTVHSA